MSSNQNPQRRPTAGTGDAGNPEEQDQHAPVEAAEAAGQTFDTVETPGGEPHPMNKPQPNPLLAGETASPLAPQATPGAGGKTTPKAL